LLLIDYKSILKIKFEINQQDILINFTALIFKGKSEKLKKNIISIT
jgi:hypothetical protein